MARKLIVLLALVAGFGTCSAQVFFSVGHVAPVAESIEETTVNLTVNSTPTLNRFTYGSFTGYFPVGPAGTYDIEFKPFGESVPSASAITDFPEGSYTVLFAGDGVNQPVEVLIFRDETEPPTAGLSRLRLLHLAPFAGGGNDTEVEILTDDGRFIDRLTYPGVSLYQELEPGLYDLKFTPPDGTFNYADALPVELAVGATTSLAVIGDGINQPFTIVSPELGALPLENPTDETATGLFFDPAVPGQGIQSIVLPRQDRLLGYVYTFDTAGERQVWYHFDSCQSLVGQPGCEIPGGFDGITGQVAVYVTSAGVFNSRPASVQRTGTATVTMLDCDTMVFEGALGNAAGPVRLTYTRLGDRVACAPGLGD